MTLPKCYWGSKKSTCRVREKCKHYHLTVEKKKEQILTAGWKVRLKGCEYFEERKK